MEISSGPPARNVFSVPFLIGAKPLATYRPTFGQGPRMSVSLMLAI